MRKINANVDWAEHNFCCFWEDKYAGIVAVTNKDLDRLKEQFEESVKEHIRICVEDGDNIPNYLKTGQYEIEYTFTVAAILRDVERFISMSALSKVCGINQKQLSHYANGTKKPRHDKREKIIEGIHEIGRQALAIA